VWFLACIRLGVIIEDNIVDTHVTIAIRLLVLSNCGPVWE